MLKENATVKQERGGRRRWFEDDDLELIVWYRPAGEIDGFQLCYGAANDERALTWRPGVGFAPSRVDAGDATPLRNETPVLAAGGETSWEKVTALFRDRSAQLEPPLRDFVLGKLAAGAAAS